MAEKIYLALGTNIGDREANLRRALAALPPDFTLVQVSPIYQTAPWGVTDQDEFLNQVVEAKTELAPEELLAYLKTIERQLGRKASFHWGPRLIDLDILFYGDKVYKSEYLRIPHAHLHERSFVLVPLADIAPNLRHPVLKLTVSEMLKEVGRNGVDLYEEASNG